MRTTTSDPWSLSLASREICENGVSSDDNCSFEDSFVSTSSISVVASNTRNSEDLPRLPDSEQYLARLDSRLKAIKRGTSKRDLINSLSVAKEDCIARLIKAGEGLEKPEEIELAANPIIRHIAPHLQALTANELVHLLKADALEAAVNEQTSSEDIEDSENKSVTINGQEENNGL
ncbi:uncharacterized protein LOC106647036 [Copidosoma floridanum]|uniref:uncharacterized protein LOC106647036 n=1 Tax=Copidosoma floridanum TaxID=29053 RepID=UPI0006C99DDD|nr:uncharacterized protein LOC106647036 [Copidosoma floridanum]